MQGRNEITGAVMHKDDKDYGMVPPRAQHILNLVSGLALALSGSADTDPVRCGSQTDSTHHYYDEQFRVNKVKNPGFTTQDTK